MHDGLKIFFAALFYTMIVLAVIYVFMYIKYLISPDESTKQILRL
jgi:hypothetical protein